jgi:C4-dicarboxylate transporter DctQ subunit
MRTLVRWVSRVGEFVAAIMMAAMFATFILQITIRYSSRLEWLVHAVPILSPDRYSWTLDFCLLMWVWIVFWGNSLIVRERDHVTFDILYTAVNPRLRRIFAIVSALAIVVGLLWSLGPTWHKFRILGLKQTASLHNLFGNWIRVWDTYSIYFAFLVIVPIRYAWRAFVVARYGVESDLHHYDDMARPDDARHGASPE